MTGPIFDTHAHYSARAFDADRFALLDSHRHPPREPAGPRGLRRGGACPDSLRLRRRLGR